LFVDKVWWLDASGDIAFLVPEIEVATRMNEGIPAIWELACESCSLVFGTTTTRILFELFECGVDNSNLQG